MKCEEIIDELTKAILTRAPKTAPKLARNEAAKILDTVMEVLMCGNKSPTITQKIAPFFIRQFRDAKTGIINLANLKDELITRARKTYKDTPGDVGNRLKTYRHCTRRIGELSLFEEAVSQVQSTTHRGTIVPNAGIEI